MFVNSRLNQLAQEIRNIVSDLRNKRAASEEGIAELMQTILVLSALSSLTTPLPQAAKVAELACEEIADELYQCMDFIDAGLPVQWAPTLSYGLDLFRAVASIALSEIVAERIGFTLTYDEWHMLVSVGPSNCCCEEPCVEIFDVLEAHELLKFVRDCELLELEGQADAIAEAASAKAMGRVH